MYKKLICFILYSFVFSETVLHDFGYKKIFASDFFYETPKNQWIELDSLNQKEGFVNVNQKTYYIGIDDVAKNTIRQTTAISNIEEPTYARLVFL